MDTHTHSQSNKEPKRNKEIRTGMLANCLRTAGKSRLFELDHRRHTEAEQPALFLMAEALVYTVREVLRRG